MLVVKLPLDAAAPGRSLTVRAESQGCADVGVCYPPQVQQVDHRDAGRRRQARVSGRGRAGEEALVQLIAAKRANAFGAV